jgi:nucleoid-associated protein YgaU
MPNTSLSVVEGDDHYRIATQTYGDAAAWTLIAQANGLTDPIVQTDATLTIPDYSKTRANDGVLAPT